MIITHNFAWRMCLFQQHHERKKCGFKRTGGPFASTGPSFLNMSDFDALALLKISVKGFIIAKFQDILLSFNPTEFF